MHDIAVIGAGPAGSTLALALAQRGWDVVLIERDALPRHKVCGEFLSPEAQGTLRQLGLSAQLGTLSPTPLTHATLTAPGGATLRTALPGQAWGLSRYALDTALAEAAARQGATLWCRTTVTALQPHSSGYTIHLRGSDSDRPAMIRTRTAVMAGGRHTSSQLPPHSATRNRLSGWRRCVGIKCHYEGVAMPPQVDVFLFAGGYVGVNPVEGGRVNVCMLITYERLARAGKSIAGIIAAAARWNDAFARRLEGGRPVTATTCSVAPVDSKRPAKPWAGMACVGDAAAMISPLCGDGMAMALHAALLCAPLADAFLRGESSLAAWERAYTSVWQGEFRQRLRLGRWLQTLLGRPVTSAALIGLGRRVPAVTAYLVGATRGKDNGSLEESSACLP